MHRAYKVKLYPNKKQKELCYQYADYARFAYNWGLAYAKQQYENTGKTPSWMTIKKEWNAIKYMEYGWTNDLLQRPAEEAIRNLGKAFTNFWKDRKKERSRKAGFPKFKSKYAKKSFRLYGISVGYSKIKLSGLGWIGYRQPNYIPTDVKYLGITVSYCGDAWWATVLVEEEHEIEQAIGVSVGVDLGIKQLATTSEGHYYDNPSALKNNLKKLKRVQRQLSRQQQGSNNYHKTKKKIAKLHYKISSIRQNATHIVSSDIIGRNRIAEERPTVVVLENLNVSGMMKNHHLAQAIADANMREMRRQLEYKAKWFGSDVVYADRFYPSSKTCSNCGYIKTNLTLADRIFICPECGIKLDRDFNAACNLKKLAY